MRHASRAFMFSTCRHIQNQSACTAWRSFLFTRVPHRTGQLHDVSNRCPKKTRLIPQRGYATIGPERNTIGAFTPTSAALFVLAGVGLAIYFRQEKARLEEERERERGLKSYGRPQIGGNFTLTTHEHNPFTQDDLLGKWSLVYFGFTNCPDICPTELDKMSNVVNSSEKKHGEIFQPVFISVDPARDSISRISQYLKDFHSSFVGLVGDYPTTKAVCKAYRVYFSTPPNADPKGDYLVDHSIFIYLMDPDGNFVDAFGQQVTAEEAGSKLDEAIEEWQKDHGGKRV